MEKQRILNALNFSTLPCTAGGLHPGAFCLPLTKDLEDYIEVANWAINEVVFPIEKSDKNEKREELQLYDKTPLELSKSLISLMYDKPSKELSNCDLSVEAMQLQTLCLLEEIEELSEHLKNFSKHTRKKIDITRQGFYGRETYN